MKTLARGLVLVASVVLTTSIAAEAANAHSHPSHAARNTHRQSYAPRFTYGYQVPPPGYAYDAQANPNYGFGPIVKIQPTDVVAGH